MTEENNSQEQELELEGWEEPDKGSAFVRWGIFGDTSSGKTKTTTMAIIGLAKSLNIKNVFMFDTEGGARWVKRDFDKFNIKLKAKRTRSFEKLVNGAKQLIDKAPGTILIVDSITAFWENLQIVYKKAQIKSKNLDMDPLMYRLQFQDWAVLKPTWKRWTDIFLNCPMHVFVCGREQELYDYIIQGGERELLKTGERMKSEKSFGYEPDFLIRMELEKKSAIEADFSQLNKTQAKSLRSIIATDREFVHCARVIKDKSDNLQGKKFYYAPMNAADMKKNQVFKDFNPYFKMLNPDAEANIVDVDDETGGLFPGTQGEPEWLERQTQKSIALENMEGTLIRYFNNAEKQLKQEALRRTFGTISMTEIQKKISLEDLVEAVYPGEQEVSPLEEACKAIRMDSTGKKSKTKNDTPEQVEKTVQESVTKIETETATK